MLQEAGFEFNLEFQEMLQRGARSLSSGWADSMTQLSYATSGGVILLGLSLQSWAAVFGIIGVVGTLCMTWVFKRRELREYQRHLEVLRAELIKQGVPVCEKP